ncbi:hypothetical protein ABZ777_30925, partial [Micromonospora parva]|uniref:hypothetical protein n=1 Tax=Micromonospora parva TaxID=1464048 RepID=UPI0033C864ED
MVLWLVCGCSLRTQQGACKASANDDLYPGLVRPFGLAGWDSFGNKFVCCQDCFPIFVGEFDPGSGRT